jgi:hypothetical protein
VLIFGCTTARRASRFAALVGAAFALSVMGSMPSWTSAHAQETRTGGCVGNGSAFDCVTRWGPAGDPFIRIVPPPADKAAKTRAVERERRWVDRCRPVIMQDRYGVARYRYAMPGCEFGVGEY